MMDVNNRSLFRGRQGFGPDASAGEGAIRRKQDKEIREPKEDAADGF